MEMSRRTALGLMGGAAATAAATAAIGPAVASAAPANGNVRALINGAPAAVGSYVFPDEVDSLVLDNG